MSVKSAEQISADKRRQKKLLLIIIDGVIALHALAIIIFGSLVMFRHFFKKETTFVAPPEVTKRLDPRKLEHKVKVQQQQQKSGRPRVQPRLSAAKISDFALPEVKTQIAPVKDQLKSNLKSFGAAGVGTGTAGGQGAGGLGLSTSAVRFMGFSAQVERVAVLIDLSPSMLEDERGSFEGFDALKNEVKEMVGALSPGSFFNIIAFERAVDIFSPDALLANKDNKNRAKEWIDPYMTDRVNIKSNGLRERNYKPGDGAPLLPNQGGITRTDLALLAAFESGVDTIFLVTDGVHHIYVDEDDKAKEKRLAEAKKNEAITQKRREKFEEERQKENERRAKRGLPPKIVESEGFTSVPPLYSDSEVIKYLREAAKKIYGEKGKPLPKVFVIGYVTTPDKEKFLKDLATEFKGRFRRARALVRPITE